MLTDLLPELARNAKTISQYWQALTDPRATELIPEDILPVLRREIEDNLRPASEQAIDRAVAVIGGQFIPSQFLQDPEAFFLAMAPAFRRAALPADILNEAISQYQQIDQWTPHPSVIIKIARPMVEERRRRLHLLDRIEDEHRRRLERELECGREPKRRRELEARALEIFGEEAPLPGDIELADALSSPGIGRRGRELTSWRVGLANDEPWAAVLCRRLALVERVRRAYEQGRASDTEAMAEAELVVSDEEASRRQIDDIESRAPGYSANRPPLLLWPVIRAIEKECGFSRLVPESDSGDPRADSIAHLQGLADPELVHARVILEHQFIGQWSQRRAAPEK
jgi:hypothetical protein